MTPLLVPTRVSVRPAVPDDASSIALVEAASWAAAYSDLLPAQVLEHYTAPGRWRTWQSMLRAGGPELAFVAEDDLGVVGYASFGPTRDTLSRRAGFAGELYTLYVLPDSQKRGIGRELFREVQDCLSANGQVSVVVWMLKGGPALNFYRRMGGRRLWERQSRLFGHRLNELALGWRELG
ncbi:GNAT family N-acetyltransferase [Marinivivus vitaminiproducens]|uniref:GNAT family N-acetyltransferase n=1 Tax=Marinivivus vitaminiproducens TaxID=3035935 RepID=UPI0027A02109|nr:GNAT family N-acetyltransferase [Geminicoccaceae bacterium SCSIO 64248]